MDDQPRILEHRVDGPYATAFGKTDDSKFAWGLLDLAQQLPIEDQSDLMAAQTLILERLMMVLDMEVLHATLAIGAHFGQIKNYLAVVEQAMAQKPSAVN